MFLFLFTNFILFFAIYEINLTLAKSGFNSLNST